MLTPFVEEDLKMLHEERGGAITQNGIFPGASFAIPMIPQGTPAYLQNILTRDDGIKVAGCVTFSGLGFLCDPEKLQLADPDAAQQKAINDILHAVGLEPFAAAPQKGKRLNDVISELPATYPTLPQTFSLPVPVCEICYAKGRVSKKSLPEFKAIGPDTECFCCKGVYPCMNIVGLI